MSQSNISMGASQMSVWTYRLSCRSDLRAKGSTSVWCEPVDRVRAEEDEVKAGYDKKE